MGLHKPYIHSRVPMVVCIVRKPRLCLSYNRRRDRINPKLLRSYYKGRGGVLFHKRSHLSECEAFSHFLGPFFGVPPILGWVRGWVRVGAVFRFGAGRRVVLASVLRSVRGLVFGSSWPEGWEGGGGGWPCPWACKYAQGVHGRPWQQR